MTLYYIQHLWETGYVYYVDFSFPYFNQEKLKCVHYAVASIMQVNINPIES